VVGANGITVFTITTLTPGTHNIAASYPAPVCGEPTQAELGWGTRRSAFSGQLDEKRITEITEWKREHRIALG